MFCDELQERLKVQREQLDIRNRYKINIHLVFKEDGAIVDNRAGTEHINNESVSFELSCDIDGALLDELDLAYGLIFVEQRINLCDALRL